MLVQLHISDFAIIKHLDIRFRPGMNILSGETGAGKSIIINAVHLMLGARASSELIRTGCREASVEGLFVLPESGWLAERLREFSIPFEGELLIRRTISREGRNRVRINGAMATLQMLSTLSSGLISISGQHEHQVLLRPENHLAILDEAAGLLEERAEFRERYDACRRKREQVEGLRQEVRRLEEQRELSRFQMQEIDAAEIRPDEDEALEEERRRLRHVEEVRAAISQAYETFYERDDSILAAVAQCGRGLEKAVHLDSRLEAVHQSAEDIAIKVEDISLVLRDLRETVHPDPARLRQVSERLETLHTLKRKYGPALADVISFRERLSGHIQALTGKRQELESSEREYQDLAAQLLDAARRLSRNRRHAAKAFEQAAERELHELHMEKTRFRVEFRQDRHTDSQNGEDVGPEGLDQVEFLISPNVGEDLKPLSKIASGGELSRITLALKTILARKASLETVVFDEVDAGVSGATAAVVGDKLTSLSEYHQIFCITHLPQIASKGEAHFRVRKQVEADQTQTVIAELSWEERVQEIARLLGGKEVTDRALAHAEDLLGGKSG